jgi:hypothetical protein
MTKYRNGNTRLRRALAVLIAAAVSLGAAACGGGSDQATKLLRATFAGRHRINSGNVAVVLTVTPKGPSGLKGPIALSIAGPFQNLGRGKLPASVFNISLAAMGTDAAVTVTSTGSTGYVTFQGQSYKLPQATFQRLESSFAQLGSTPGASGSGVLGRLGIQPQHWLVNPHVLGDEGISGVNTTHIRAAINVAALLSDLNRFLERAASLGEAGAGSFPRGIPAATRQRIAGEVKNPTVDVWTGVADKTLRRLEIALTVPVGGQLSGLIGRSASIALTMEYADLNQPQLIRAPTKLLPYSEFQDKLRVLIGDLEGGLTGGGLPGGAAGSGSAGAAGSGPNYQAYTDCILSANGNLARMQRCAPLLNGQ